MMGPRQSGIADLERLDGHPKRGASWEGLALDQVIHGLATRDAYFWVTHGGAELDLLVPVSGRRYGFEFKLADAPSTSRSMWIALDDLELDRLKWEAQLATPPSSGGYSPAG